MSLSGLLLFRDFRRALYMSPIETAILAVLELANGPKSSLTFRGKTAEVGKHVEERAEHNASECNER